MLQLEQRWRRPGPSSVAADREADLLDHPPVRGGRSVAHIPPAAGVQTQRRPGIGQVIGVR